MTINSFVFLDSETTGLPALEYNKTKITELCLISVQVECIFLGVIPRVQNKLTLCFNPMKRITPNAEHITKLYNDELANESTFDSTSVNLIINFLNRLKKPICFVAHNGNRFDYPILRNHIEQTGEEFPEDILCIDSLLAFRELIKQSPEPNKKETNINKIENGNKNESTVDGEVQPKEDIFSDNWDDVLYNEVRKLEESFLETPPKACTSKQIENETTPKAEIKCVTPKAPKASRKAKTNTLSRSSVIKKLNFNSPTLTKQSFKLGDVYQRLTSKEPVNTHHAEEDVKMLLTCAVHLGDAFLEYANKNAIPFNQIPMMEVGKCMGLKILS